MAETPEDPVEETQEILADPADRAVFEAARREADSGELTDEQEMAALMRGRRRPAKTPGYAPEHLHPVTGDEPSPLTRALLDERADER